MQLFILLCVFLCIFSACAQGCGNTTNFVSGKSNIFNLTTADGDRSFQVYFPTSYTGTSPVPIVFVFHGGGGDANYTERFYGMDPVGEQNGFLVVYPNGLGKAWNGGLCCNPASTNNYDDIGFTNDIIDLLEENYCIDPKRIYATGMSNGAIFSYRIGCQLANRVAAIAIVEGALEYFPCTPSRPISTLVLHGDSDINVPFEGGYGCGKAVTGVNYTAVPVSVSTFLQANNCSCSFEAGAAGTCGQFTTFPDGTNCSYFGACAAPNVNVSFCRIKNGGHSWPGSVYTASVLPNCNKSIGDFPASKQIWSFFSTQLLPDTASNSSTTSNPTPVPTPSPTSPPTSSPTSSSTPAPTSLPTPAPTSSSPSASPSPSPSTTPTPQPSTGASTTLSCIIYFAIFISYLIM